jgi:hypothetical protein
MIYQLAFGLAMPLLLVLAVLVVLCLVWMSRLFGRLRLVEPEAWNALGQPDLLISHTPAMYWRLCRFLYGEGVNSIHDPVAARDARILGGLFKVLVWVLGALLLMLALANILRH